MNYLNEKEREYKMKIDALEEQIAELGAQLKIAIEALTVAYLNIENSKIKVLGDSLEELKK